MTAQTGIVPVSIAALVALGLLSALLAEHPSRDTFGSARFARSRDLKRVGLIGDRSGHRLELGIWRSYAVGIPETRQQEHVLLVAPTGMGKTSGVIIPGLLTEDGHRGIFVNDVKGELYAVCAGYLSQFMPVYVFAPSDPSRSVYYNPLSYVSSMEDAADLAQSWIDNTGLSREPYWNETAKLLMTATILHLREAEPEAPFVRMSDILTAGFTQVRHILSKSPSSQARHIGATFLSSIAADPKLAGGIMSGLSSRFLLLQNQTLRQLTATNPDPQCNLDFARLSQGPAALFLSVPAADTRRLKPLTAVLIMQLMRQLTAQKTNHKHPFVLYMDELANAGKIPHYATYISLVRDQGVSLIQAIQDFGQLRREYGEHDSNTILSNSNTKVFFPGMGMEEATYASRLTGDATVPVESISQHGTNTGKTVSSARRRLMTPDEIRRMRQNCLLVITSNVPPVVVSNRRYFEQPRIAKRAGLGQD